MVVFSEKRNDMSKAVLIGIILLVAAAVACFIAYRSAGRFEDRFAFIMIAAVAFTCSVALFGIRELPDDKLERVRACLDDGYSLVLDDHEVASDTIAEYIDKYVILHIDDSYGIIYIKSTDESPFSMK